MQRCRVQFIFKTQLAPAVFHPHSQVSWFASRQVIRPSFRGHNAGCVFLRSFNTIRRLPNLFGMAHRPTVAASLFQKRRLSTSPPLSLRYHVPQPRHRKSTFFGFLDKLPPNAVFYGILGLNATVFVMWFMAIQKYVRHMVVQSYLYILFNFSLWLLEARRRPIGGHLDARKFLEQLEEFGIWENVGNFIYLSTLLQSHPYLFSKFLVGRRSLHASLIKTGPTSF